MAGFLLIIDTVERSGAPSIIESVPSPTPGAGINCALTNYLVNTEPTEQKIENSHGTSFKSTIAPADTK